jgi:hypothetical protein
VNQIPLKLESNPFTIVNEVETSTTARKFTDKSNVGIKPSHHDDTSSRHTYLVKSDSIPSLEMKNP